MNTPGNTNKPDRNTRRRGGCLSLILFLLLLGIMWAADTLYRRLLTPWGVDTADRPALFGEWSGPVTMENGVSGTLLLTLEDTLSWQEELLEGRAHYYLDDVSGDFEVSGHIDRQGNVADLRFRPIIDDPVWLLNAMSSRWQNDTLTISGTSSYDLSAQQIVRSDVPQPAITITLHRGAAGTDCLWPGS